MTNFTNEQLEAWAGLAWQLALSDDTTILDKDRRIVAELCCSDNEDADRLDYNNPDEWPLLERNAALIAAAPALAAELLAERKAREVEVEVGEAKAEITRLRQSLADIANGTNSWFNQAEEALLNARSRIRNEARQALKGQRDD